MNNKLIYTTLIIITISAIITLSACTQKTTPNPNILEPICTADYTPVCGVDEVTYSNKCMAQDVEIAYEGECKETHICTQEEKDNKACTREYSPVCGNDENTYSNKCTACSQGIDSYTIGECITEKNFELPENCKGEKHICSPEEKTAVACTMEYMPVIGSDGKEYSNGCSACSQGIEFYTISECLD